MPNWNPIQYEKFLKDRTQPAVDLANRLEVISPSRILDLGCGPGNSSKALKDKFPNAKLTGADNSDEMLAKARKSYPDIEFINLDANGDLNEINEKFDMLEKITKTEVDASLAAGGTTEVGNTRLSPKDKETIIQLKRMGWNVDDMIEVNFNSILAPNDEPCLVLDYSCCPRYDFRGLM